jgi:hypothetical protein
LILLLYRSSLDKVWYLWAILGIYFLAKVLELLDEPIYRMLGTVSGHTLKHLLAAGGALVFLLALQNRRPLENG